VQPCRALLINRRRFGLALLAGLYSWAFAGEHAFSQLQADVIPGACNCFAANYGRWLLIGCFHQIAQFPFHLWLRMP